MLATISPAVFHEAEATPLCWRRTFPGSAEQARAVRRFVACLLGDGCGRLDDVLLAADELVGNALRHTKSGQDGGSLAVRLQVDGDEVTVSVTDQGGPSEPVAKEAGEWDESGRGLRTVALLATSWGWHGNDRSRTVTAVFAPAAR
jgi:anti-sigma regulatory factor (Ser/Thr protein kinase)